MIDPRKSRWRECRRIDCEDSFEEHGNGRDGGPCHHRETMAEVVRRMSRRPDLAYRPGGLERERCECPAFVEVRR
jgi:hypothetical protein